MYLGNDLVQEYAIQVLNISSMLLRIFRWLCLNVQDSDLTKPTLFPKSAVYSAVRQYFHTNLVLRDDKIT
jgi:hypothetical protein